MAIIAMTTSSSMSVKAGKRRLRTRLLQINDISASKNTQANPGIYNANG